MSDLYMGQIMAECDCQHQACAARGYCMAALVAELEAKLAEARAKGMEEAAQTCETHGALGGPTPNPYAEWKTHADNLAATIRARAAEVRKKNDE